MLLDPYHEMKHVDVRQNTLKCVSEMKNNIVQLVYKQDCGN
jgi:hypothetical protein